MPKYHFIGIEQSKLPFCLAHFDQSICSGIERGIYLALSDLTSHKNQIFYKPESNSRYTKREEKRNVMSLPIFETTQFSAKVYKNISILCDISTKCLKIPPIKFSETHVLTFNHSNTQRNTNFAPEEVHSSRIVARFLSRCSQLLNIRRESAATAEERRKITFCMRIAKPQETPIHSPRH